MLIAYDVPPAKRGQKAKSERSHHQSDLMNNRIISDYYQRHHHPLHSIHKLQSPKAIQAWLGKNCQIMIVSLDLYFICISIHVLCLLCLHCPAIVVLTLSCIFTSCLYLYVYSCIFCIPRFYILYFHLHCVVLWACTAPALI